MKESDYAKVVKMLESVPSVKEHMSKPSTKRAMEVTKKRFDLNLTRQELAEKGNEMGCKFTSKDLMRIESGHEDIEQDILNNVFRCLDNIESYNENSATSYL